jgi:predicted choloylglycine hydrolase
MGFSALKRSFTPLLCTGDAHARGLTQGSALEKQISLCLNAFYQSSLFSQLRSRSLPIFINDRLIRMRARQHIWKDLQKSPEHLHFMQGMAKGAKQDLHHLLLFCAVEGLLASRPYQMGACSMVLVPPRFSNTGEALMIKNFDYPYFLKAFNLLRENRPEGEGANTLEMTLAPQSGCHTGMNTEGLAITYNTARGPSQSASHLPISLQVQEALRHCKNADDAVSWFKKGQQEGGGILGVMDNQKVFLVEVYGSTVRAEEITDKPLLATNHYQLMPEHNPPVNAYYATRGIPELAGDRLNASSEARLDRLNELAGTRIHFHPQDLLDYFQDHGSPKAPGDHTLCRHGRFYETTGSILLMPQRREAQINLDAPCESNYVSYQWF